MSKKAICVVALSIALGLVPTPEGAAQAPRTEVRNSPVQRSGWEVFGPWEFSFESADLKFRVTLKTDVGVLIPHVQSHSREDKALLDAFSRGTRSLASANSQIVLKSGWGHVAPYLFDALYDAAGRVLYGLLSTPRTAAGDQLVPLNRRGTIELTIRAFANRDDYQRKAAHVTDVSSEAYWDPATREIGLFLDGRLFAWLGYQSGLGRDDLEYTLASARLYIRRLVLRKITHELVHAMQLNADDKLLHFPLVVEGGALYLASYVFRVEEFSEFSKIASKGGEFSGFPKRMWPYSYDSIAVLRKADSYLLANPKLSLSQLLRVNARSFYGADRREASVRYAIARSLVEFLLRADRDTALAWRNVVEELYNDDALVRARSDAKTLDAQFRAWLDALGKAWWRNENAEKFHEESISAVSRALTSREFLSAYLSALAACALQPDDPVAVVYLGDVFYRSVRIYWAYDYYAAAAFVQESRPDSSSVLVRSRLGDSYYELGDLERALDEFRKATADPSKVTTRRDLFAYYRSGIKRRFLEATRESGTWRTKAHGEKLQAFVNDFFAVVTKLEASGHTDGPEYFAALESQYSLVRAKIQWSLLAPKDQLTALRATFIRWSSLGNANPTGDAAQLEALWSLIPADTRALFARGVPYFYCYWIEQSEWLAHSLDERVLLPEPPSLVRMRGLLQEHLGSLEQAYRERERKENAQLEEKLARLQGYSDEQVNKANRAAQESTNGAATTLGEMSLLTSLVQYRKTHKALYSMLDRGELGQLSEGSDTSLTREDLRKWLEATKATCPSEP